MPRYKSANFGLIKFVGGVSLIGSADALTLAGGQLLVAGGTKALPGLGIAGDPDSGVYSILSNRLMFTSAGSSSFGIWADSLRINMPANFQLTWSGVGQDAEGTGISLAIWAESAGVAQFGDDSATPIAQTLKGADARAGTDTDTVGGKLTIGAGRSTGTGVTAGVAIATGVHATTANTANTNVDRVLVNEYGVVGFTPHDNTAVPVASTAALKLFAYNKSVADHGIITMPVITSHAYGILSTNSGATYTHFVVNATGTVTLLGPLVMTTADVVANAATDAKVDIGTAGAQEPLQIANELGSTQVFNILFWYD